ncbi:MAG: hypothetical protein L0Y72_18915 [Gemmataceae bacterium]|nr:hypothetical protein [Gemmataceae bacterium]MCI0741121.1 hypothetical protein [Gemmataceae bacterium]
MTFLQYVCWELLGPPAYGSAWHCPFCDPGSEQEWASFSVRPPLGSHPIKFRCHRCQRWGDEHDILKHALPGDENRDERRLRLAELMASWLHDKPSPLGEDERPPPEPFAVVLRRAAQRKRREPPKEMQLPSDGIEPNLGDPVVRAALARRWKKQRKRGRGVDRHRS